MAWYLRALEILNDDETPTGKWRMTATSDEDGGGPWALCDCEGGHDSMQEARECPKAKERMEMYP